MLFARFLAENGLLLWEPGAAVSLDDCEALVQEADPAMNLGAKTKWELAGKLAARMLPQVFKPQSPVFELAFAPEHQRELVRLLAALPPATPPMNALAISESANAASMRPRCPGSEKSTCEVRTVSSWQ